MKAIVTYELYSAGKHCKHARLFKHIRKIDVCGNSSCDYRAELYALTDSDLRKLYNNWYSFARLAGPRIVEYNNGNGSKIVRIERIWEC